MVKRRMMMIIQQGPDGDSGSNAELNLYQAARTVNPQSFELLLDKVGRSPGLPI